jgi:chitodextrinase
MEVPDGPMRVESGPLALISIRAAAVTASSAVLSWYSFLPADSSADVGSDDTYGTTTPLDTEAVTTHRVQLTGLQPDTEYHYRVLSTDESGNQAVSRDHTFRTLSDSCSTGNAFYVDGVAAGGDGSSWETAWQSPDEIDWASVGPGDCVLFAEGEYAESLLVTGSGVANNPITIYPVGPVVLTGDVLVQEGAHDIQIRGFEITGLQNDKEARGPDIGISGDRSAFLDNFLHHTNGISLGGSGNVARNNLLFFTHGISIVVAGTDGAVEDNDVSHTICGFWGDADTSRFFGERNAIRNNFFHDVLDEESPGCSPHCDCFQTYSVNEGEAAHDITIENNYCFNICGQMFMGEGILENNTHSDLTFRGNVFEKVGAIAINAGGIRNMIFDHNTFVDSGLGAIAIGDAPGSVISNNLFYNNPYAYGLEGGAANYNWIFPFDCHNEFVEPNGTYGADPLLLDPMRHNFQPTPGSAACVAGQGESHVGALACDPVTECFDPDGDGFGKPTSSFCEHEEADCDNAKPNAFPGNIEVCDDEVDNDCDGLRNEDCADALPLLELHFDNGIEDSSPSGFSLVWEGGDGSFGEGQVNEALLLSGGDSPYVVAADDPRLGNMGLLYISVYAKKNSPRGGTIFLKHVCYSLNVGEDTIDAYIQTEGGAIDLDVYGTSAVNDTDWHHYEMTYDIRTGKAALLVDGVELSTGDGSGKVRWDSCDLRDIYIGKDPWGDAFDGLIDELVIYDTVW